MPMFQPLKRDGLVGFEGGGDGQVLDLDTAVKDGLLGGVNGGGGVVDEKIDLKTMIKELDLQDIPSVFICPISLEPMQDPVTLCTGQTYERSNIHKWFSLGHLTCPTTMQELWDDAVTPNRTLHHLIYTWFSQVRVDEETLRGCSRTSHRDRRGSSHGEEDCCRRRRRLCRLFSLGPFTSHAVGSEVVAILVSLDLDSDSKSGLMQPAKVSLIVDMLNDGSNETKVNCVRLIRGLVEEKGFRPELVSSHSLLVGLIRLVKDKRHRNGVSPALGLLKPISAHKQVRSLMVRVGAVPQLVDILPSLDPDCLESALFVLDALCSDMEGRVAVKDSANTIPYTVKVLMRVTESCTNYALSILWSVCKLAPEECSPLAVEVGLAAKLLLVIQSGCDPALKQRSASYSSCVVYIIQTPCLFPNANSQGQSNSIKFISLALMMVQWSSICEMS
ncbi:hypothetical protein Bca52824_023163 [Brassica carinata]|uniref:U-box domain-containing protein n=1 Tax=Brassica carinata TaxID=52824 RepID=A0A8X7VHX7_BRACI|nr:hypothetical protein Bca52824_023163 [Brassica carinata]